MPDVEKFDPSRIWIRPIPHPHISQVKVNHFFKFIRLAFWNKNWRGFFANVEDLEFGMEWIWIGWKLIEFVGLLKFGYCGNWQKIYGGIIFAKLD